MGPRSYSHTALSLAAKHHNYSFIQSNHEMPTSSNPNANPRPVRPPPRTVADLAPTEETYGFVGYGGGGGQNPSPEPKPPQPRPRPRPDPKRPQPRDHTAMIYGVQANPPPQPKEAMLHFGGGDWTVVQPGGLLQLGGRDKPPPPPKTP